MATYFHHARGALAAAEGDFPQIQQPIRVTLHDAVTG